VPSRMSALSGCRRARFGQIVASFSCARMATLSESPARNAWPDTVLTIREGIRHNWVAAAQVKQAMLDHGVRVVTVGNGL
jgi:hypothetical protein